MCGGNIKSYIFMKNKKYKLILYLLIVYILFFTECVSNVGSLIASRGYFIPKESSVFTFSVVLENPGNGEYWIYGEDKKYYYYSGISPYVFIEKENTCPHFNRIDYRTWCGVDIREHEGYPE